MIRVRGGRRAALSMFVALGVAVGGAGGAVAAPGGNGTITVVGTNGGEARAAVRIMAQPRSVKVVAGRTTTFKVKAAGASLTYRWQTKASGSTSWKSVKGGTKSTLKVRATAKIDGASYRVVVAKGRTKVTSKVAKLLTISTPRITLQPKAVTASVGATATFTVGATGRDLAYTWQSKVRGATSWSNVGTSRTFKVSAASPLHGASYRVVVRNAAGAVSSRTVTLSVPVAPRVVTQPVSARVTAGDRVTLTVEASGSDLRYQWQKRSDDAAPWVNVQGGKGTTLAFAARTATSGDSYRVVVTNGLGSATSAVARVFVDSTYADPAAIGDVVILNDWGLVVVERTRNGTDEVLAWSSWNDTPPAGWGYILTDVVACYAGTSSARPFADLRFTYVGSDARAYSDDGNVLPNDLYYVGELFPDGCASFTVGALLPTSAVAGGRWSIEDSSGYPTARAFVSGS